MPPAATMPSAPREPAVAPPAGACDAHVHIVAGAEEFPLWEGRVEDPAPGPDLDGWLALYREHLDTLGFSHGVLVHSILYGGDNAVTLEALRRLGSNFRAVCLVRDDVGERDLDRLADAGARAVRLNYVHGGLLSWQGAKRLAPMLVERGLHVEMLLHSHLHAEELADDIRGFPTPVVIDHLGWPDPSLGTSEPGFQCLLRLVSEGAAHVKLSAANRMGGAPYDAVAGQIAALAAANPDRCLWGSDWPHLMLGDAAMPHAAALLDQFHDIVTGAESRKRILCDTPAALYRFDQ